MSTRHVLDELSSYIDGVCRDPERIARHLQSCPSCARQHLELRKLSAHLRALPAPEVSPHFATRVMARVEDESIHTPLFSPFTLRLIGVACVVVAVVGLTFRLQPRTNETETLPPVNLAWQDDERVVEEFSRLMDAGIALDLFGDPEDYDAEEPWAPLDEHFVLEALAEDVSEEELGSDAPDDLAALLEALSEVDVQTLNELLADFENEG